MMVTLVDLQMLGQMGDALGQERDLHVGRTGVALRDGVLVDDRVGRKVFSFRPVLLTLTNS